MVGRGTPSRVPAGGGDRRTFRWSSRPAGALSEQRAVRGEHTMTGRTERACRSVGLVGLHRHRRHRRATDDEPDRRLDVVDGLRPVRRTPTPTVSPTCSTTSSRSTGIDVAYTGSVDFVSDVRQRAIGNQRPDVAIVPQPGVVDASGRCRGRWNHSSRHRQRSPRLLHRDTLAASRGISDSPCRIAATSSRWCGIAPTSSRRTTGSCPRRSTRSMRSSSASTLVAPWPRGASASSLAPQRAGRPPTGSRTWSFGKPVWTSTNSGRRANCRGSHQRFGLPSSPSGTRGRRGTFRRRSPSNPADRGRQRKHPPVRRCTGLRDVQAGELRRGLVSERNLDRRRCRCRLLRAPRLGRRRSRVGDRRRCGGCLHRPARTSIG